MAAVAASGRAGAGVKVDAPIPVPANQAQRVQLGIEHVGDGDVVDVVPCGVDILVLVVNELLRDGHERKPIALS